MESDERAGNVTTTRIREQDRAQQRQNGKIFTGLCRIKYGNYKYHYSRQLFSCASPPGGIGHLENHNQFCSKSQSEAGSYSLKRRILKGGFLKWLMMIGYRWKGNKKYFCSVEKFISILKIEKKKDGCNDVALIRMEQIYPLPFNRK